MKLMTNFLYYWGVLVALNLMSAPISAQYLPQNTSPFYLYSICCENGYSSELCLYTTNDNDASFDGHDYIKYMVSVDTEDYKHATLYDFYFRQEEEKVFRYDPATKTEHLVFDFGLREGQEFKDMHGNRFVVLQVTDTTIVQQWDDKNMGTYKKIKLQGLDDESITDEWLQGLGSLKTGLLSFEDLKGVSLYDRYYSLTLKINRINTLIEAQTESYHVFLNVNTDMLKTAFLKPKDSIADNSAFIKEGHSLGYEFVGNSLHVVGKPNILGNNYIYLMCNVQGDKVRLNYIPVQYGPGIWGFREFGIDIYFPGFSPGTYYIGYIGNLVNESWDEEVETVCHGTTPNPGDVKADGDVDISDIVAVINVIAGIDTNSKADVNGDGKTDISDIVAIINSIAQTNTSGQYLAQTYYDYETGSMIADGKVIDTRKIIMTK